VVCDMTPNVHSEGRAPLSRASLSTVRLGRSRSFPRSLPCPTDEAKRPGAKRPRYENCDP